MVKNDKKESNIKFQDTTIYTKQDMLDFSWFLVTSIGRYIPDKTAHFKGKYLEHFEKQQSNGN